MVNVWSGKPQNIRFPKIICANMYFRVRGQKILHVTIIFYVYKTYKTKKLISGGLLSLKYFGTFKK